VAEVLILGTCFFIWGGLKREAAFQKYKSSGEGKEFFNRVRQRQRWYIQAVIFIAIRLRGGQGKIEEWAKSVNNMDDDQLKELATQSGGFFLLLFGFVLQLIGILL
jgi:hypothetical protein